MCLITLVTFLMPWLSITCSDEKLVTISGVETLTGVDIEGEEQGGIVESYVVLIAALAGLACVFLPRLARTLISAGGIAALIVMQIRLRAAISSENLPDLGIQFELGYWLALVMFLAVVLLQYVPLGNRDDAEP